VTREPALAVPSDIEKWLVALARAVQRYGLYPPGHPALGDLAADLHERLLPLLEEHGELQVGVAPDRFLYEGAWTDTGSAHLPTLAHRLHEHDLSSLGLEPGTSRSELVALLTAVRERPVHDEDRLGRRAGMASRWPHVWIEPRHYDRLTLEEHPDDALEDRDRRAARLWLGLGREARALPPELSDGSWEREPTPRVMAAARRVEPGVVAQAIAALRQQEGMEAVGAVLLEIAEELRRPDGEFDLRDRYTGLFRVLARPDVRRVLERGLRSPDRQKLLEATSAWLPADLLVRLVETTSDLGDIDVSHWMLRILVKLSGHAQVEGAPSMEEADDALRDQVRRAITGWGDEAVSNDSAYAETLRRMSDPTGDLAALPLVDAEHAPESMRMLQMAVEVDRLGPPGERAVDALLRAGRSAEIIAVADGAAEGNGVAAELWGRLTRTEVVRELLDSQPPEFDALGALAPHDPGLVTEPLLDLLIESQDRSVRGKAFSILTALGDDIGGLVMARLGDERWFVQRNMLALLYEIGAPPGFSARPFAAHDNAHVRREAYKHMLRDPDTRAEAIALCLQESDPRTLSLGLGALEGARSLEPELVSRLAHLAGDSEMPSEIRVTSARALALSDTPEAKRSLLDLCLRRHPILFWRKRPRPDTPVVREAAAALARAWPDDPAVRALLAHPEIRAAS
jgi:hypothetical protein